MKLRARRKQKQTLELEESTAIQFRLLERASNAMWGEALQEDTREWLIATLCRIVQGEDPRIVLLGPKGKMSKEVRDCVMAAMYSTLAKKLPEKDSLALVSEMFCKGEESVRRARRLYRRLAEYTHVHHWPESAILFSRYAALLNPDSLRRASKEAVGKKPNKKLPF